MRGDVITGKLNDIARNARRRFLLIPVHLRHVAVAILPNLSARVHPA